jgi:glycosyltransferase involved in cell wall biosynthesis
MNIWILQTGEPLHCDEGMPRPMRAMNLANFLIKRGHSVTIWSTDFYHQEKRHRYNQNSDIIISEHLVIKLIESPGYNKNIGLKRIYDHVIFAKNLKKRLKSIKNFPDLAFIGYPPIESSHVMANWLIKRKIKYLLDVKDQWPTIFIDAFPRYLKILAYIIFSPHFIISKKVIKNACGITTMSNSFLKWAREYSDSSYSNFDKVVALTSPNDEITKEQISVSEEWWKSMGIHENSIPKICFIGSHSRAFDMQPVFIAAKALHEAGIKCEFVICGNGPQNQNWKNLMKGLDNVKFPGWINRSQAFCLSQFSIASLAPYHNENNFINNIPNKIIDSLSFGLPILSPLKGEVYNLINDNSVGLSYGEVANISLQDCIMKLIHNPSLQKTISNNGYRLYEECFSFEKVYNGLVDHIEGIKS